MMWEWLKFENAAVDSPQLQNNVAAKGSELLGTHCILGLMAEGLRAHRSKAPVLRIRESQECG